MRFPDRSDMERLAAELNFDLTSEELDVMHDRAAGQMRSIERIMALHGEASQAGPGRVPGLARDWSFATEAEDPLRAFVTTCNLSTGKPGSLNGLRVGLKDNIAVAGIPMTLGSPELSAYVPEFDATVAQRLLRDGALICGKLNMYEFASGDAKGGFGRVINPIAKDREAGGSSSGSGAAVAAGLVDVALGGDQGGSIRIPASWCGVAGLKPTYGLVPHTGILGADPTIDHVGPLARSVRDIAKVMDSIAGADGLDPRQASISDSAGSFVGYLDGDIRGRRVGILREAFREEGKSELEGRVMAMATVLREQGAIVTDVSIPLHNLAGDAWLAIWLEGTWYISQTNLGSALQRGWYPESVVRTAGSGMQSWGHSLPYNFRQMILMGAYLHRRFFGTVYARSQNLRAAFTKAYDDALRDVDLLILPTMCSLPPKFAEGKTYAERVNLSVFGGGSIDLAEFVRNTAPFSYTGHPAVTVPCGCVEGLPVGGQIVGRFFEDRSVLQAADIVERHLGSGPTKRISGWAKA